MGKAFLGLLVILSVPAWGGDLRAPYNVEGAGVLPAGVFNPRVLAFAMSIDSQYSSGGPTEPLGTRLTRNVRWADFLRAQNEARRGLFRGILQRLGIPESDLAGMAGGTVSATADAQLPMLAYGLTDRLSAALIVPVVSIHVDVNPAFTHTQSSQKFIAAACAAAPDQCAPIRAGFDGISNVKLAAMGYEPLRSQSISGVGDVQLQGKYRLVKTETQALSAKLILSLPTGTAPNPNRAIDVTTGENRFRLGAILAYERDLLLASRLTLYCGYTALLPNEMVRRLPAGETEFLSPDKATVTRRLNHRALAGATLEYRIRAIGLTPYVGYQFQWQGQGSYRGGADPVAMKRVSWLGNFEPEEILHTAALGAAFSTVDWYRRQKFPVPFDLNVLWTRPVGGRNALTGSALVGELVAYF